MTAITWDNVSEERSSNNKPAKIIIPIAVIVAIVVGFILYFVGQKTTHINSTEKYMIGYYDLSPSEIRIIEIVSGHSWQQHGVETSKALDCLGKRGSTKSFKTRGFEDIRLNKNIPTNLWLCLDIDGNWFAIVTTIFEKDRDGNLVARLVTGYAIAKDLFPEIGDFIQYIGQKWGASYISYVIGAGQIYLQPK